MFQNGIETKINEVLYMVLIAFCFTEIETFINRKTKEVAVTIVNKIIIKN